MLSVLMKGAQLQESQGSFKMREMKSKSEPGQTQQKSERIIERSLGAQDWLYSLPAHKNWMFNFLLSLVPKAQDQVGGADIWGKFFDPNLSGVGPGRASLEWSLRGCFINIRWWKEDSQTLPIKQVCSQYYSKVWLFTKCMLILGSPHLSFSWKNWRNERDK